MAKKTLLWNTTTAEDSATIGETYEFPETIEAKSTPKTEPGAKYVMRKFNRGELAFRESKFFFFYGKEVGTNKACIFKINRKKPLNK